MWWLSLELAWFCLSTEALALQANVTGWGWINQLANLCHCDPCCICEFLIYWLVWCALCTAVQNNKVFSLQEWAKYLVFSLIKDKSSCLTCLDGLISWHTDSASWRAKNGQYQTVRVSCKTMLLWTSKYSPSIYNKQNWAWISRQSNNCQQAPSA